MVGATRKSAFLPGLLRSRAMLVILLTTAVTAFMIFAYIQQPRLITMLDYKLYDFMLDRLGNKEISEVPIVIDLDEATLAEYGQWPWPRFLLAELLDKLIKGGVASVGVDVLFLEEDRTSPRHMSEDLRRFAGIEITLDVPDAYYDYDLLLAGAIAKLPVVLGMYAYFDGRADDSADSPGAVGYVVQKTDASIPFEPMLDTADSIKFPLCAFWPSTPFGLLNMSPDYDGVVRHLPLLVRYGDKLYPTLSLRTLMVAMKSKTIALRVGRDGLESVRLGKLAIPVTPEGRMLVPFKGPGHTYPYYSAGDILQGKIPPEKLKDRIAFLGTSASGLLDIRITPLERVYPGVEVHATLLDSILQQRFLKVPPWTPGVQVLSVLFCGLISGLAFGFAPPRVYLPLGVALFGGIIYASARLFQGGVLVSPLYTLMAVVVLGCMLLFLRFWLEERQKKLLRNAFSRYVEPEVVRRITRMKGDLFAGEELETTIMFTDIRKFTSISESLRPEQVVSLLNRYFTPMTALVRRNRGTLDKFIGDALMAFWNAPVAVPGHPRLALATALAMQEELKTMNGSLRAEFGCEINMGVGVHSGKVYVGNMGSEELLNYTIIGDNVNLASRLEGLCPKYGVGVVTSGETVSQCNGGDAAQEGDDALVFQQLDTLRVKGKQHSVDVFTVMRAPEALARAEELKAWREALDAYASGDFSRAVDLLETLRAKYPESVLYRIYSERCAELVQNPPPDWDGIWTMTTK